MTIIVRCTRQENQVKEQDSKTIFISNSTPLQDDPDGRPRLSSFTEQPSDERLSELRSQLPPSSASDTLLTDGMCRRFLTARNGSLSGAAHMYKRWINFRSDYELDDIKPSSIAGMSKKKVAYWRSSDKQHRPTCIIIARRNWPRRPPDEVIR